MYSSFGDSAWSLLKKIGLSNRVKQMMALPLWEEVVGMEVSKHTRAQTINKGVMTVVANNSSWCQELSMLKTRYIHEINEKLGGKIVKDIRFKTGSIKGLPDWERTNDLPPVKVDISIEDKEKIKDLICEIRDPDLAQTYERYLLFNKRIEKLRELEGWIKCSGCGRQIPAEDIVCLSCHNAEKQSREVLIEQYLYETPWSDYYGLSGYGIEKKEFDRVKEKLTMKVRVQLENQLKKKENQDLEKQKFLGYFLAMLISGEGPQTLDEGKINSILKAKDYRIG